MSQLDEQLELDRRLLQPVLDAVRQEVGRQLFGIGIAQEMRARLRHQLIAAELGDALGIGEFERVDAEGCRQAPHRSGTGRRFDRPPHERASAQRRYQPRSGLPLRDYDADNRRHAE